MQTHGRLIRAGIDGAVSHHVAPRNGQVHDGQPALCADPTCRAWAKQLDAARERAFLAEVNAELEEDQRNRDKPIMAGIILVALFLVGVAAGFFWWWSR